MSFSVRTLAYFARVANYSRKLLASLAAGKLEKNEHLKNSLVKKVYRRLNICSKRHLFYMNVATQRHTLTFTMSLEQMFFRTKFAAPRLDFKLAF
jgi:hypothetical protein